MSQASVPGPAHAGNDEKFLFVDGTAREKYAVVAAVTQRGLRQRLLDFGSWAGDPFCGVLRQQTVADSIARRQRVRMDPFLPEAETQQERARGRVLRGGYGGETLAAKLHEWIAQDGADCAYAG